MTGGPSGIQPTSPHAPGLETALANPGRGGSGLPRPLTLLIDRDRDLAAVAELVQNPAIRLLTLTGAGGVGKTRLAIAAAEDTSSGFRDGVLYVDLIPVVDPGHVANAIAAALGLRDIGLQAPRDRLIDALSERQILLILDNFEHVVTAGPWLRDLLGACPGLTALVTSRIRLRVSGEHEYPVSPLPLPSIEATTITDAGTFGAVRLFTDRAQAIIPDFRLTPETLTAVIEIVRRVDGLPLAIELAAARLKVLPPTALLGRLEQRLPLLTGGARDLPLRQQTMRDAIAWSYDLLARDEQRLFRRLAVFTGGFTPATAEAIVAAPDGGAGDAEPGTGDLFDGISALIEQSVLLHIPGPGGEPRYTMLETIREYGLEQLEASGEAARFRAAHARVFLALAEAAEPELAGARQGDWLDRLAAEHPNQRAALTWGLAHDLDLALRLSAALRLFWRNRGHLSEGRQWLELALASGAGAPELRAKALVATASLGNNQFDAATAVAFAEEARSIYTRLGNRRGVADALRRIAPFHIHQSVADPLDKTGFARAAAIWEEEIALRQELADSHGLAWARLNLGIAAMHQGHLDRAESLLNEALPLFEALQDRNGAAYALVQGARTALWRGDLERSAGLFARSLEEFRALGDQWNMIHLIEDAGRLMRMNGRWESAVHLLGAADALRAANGLGLITPHRVGPEQGLAEARQALPEAAFAAAWDAGRQLTLAQAVELVLASFALLATKAETSAPGEHADAFTLTPREREILRFLCEGCSDREIAAALHISPRTVGGHVTNLLAKLGVESRTAAAAFAVRRGLC